MKKTIFIFVVAVAVIQIAQGLAVCFTPEALFVSPLAGLGRLSNFRAANAIAIGGMLILFGASACVAAMMDTLSLPTRLLMVLPQQIIVTIQLWSIAYTIHFGVYPDGYTPKGGVCDLLLGSGSCFIFADQIGMFTLGLFQSWEVTKAIINPDRFYRRCHLKEI